MGYSVFFNSNEERARRFPGRIRQTIENGKDFILILSEGYFNQLKRNDTDDWIRVEILTAHRFEKHFAPILMDGVEKPGDCNIYINCRFPETTKVVQSTRKREVIK